LAIFKNDQRSYKTFNCLDLNPAFPSYSLFNDKIKKRSRIYINLCETEDDSSKLVGYSYERNVYLRYEHVSQRKTLPQSLYNHFLQIKREEIKLMFHK
jgi:hypothetical protein